MILLLKGTKQSSSAIKFARTVELVQQIQSVIKSNQQLWNEIFALKYRRFKLRKQLSKSILSFLVTKVW